MKTASGKTGEDHICQWLKGQGYIIVARNYHSRYGEIDIIARRIVPGVCGGKNPRGRQLGAAL